MLTFLFWNIRRNPLSGLVAELAHEHDVDVIILAESQMAETDVLVALNRGIERQYVHPRNLSARLDFYVRLPERCLESVADMPGVAIRRLVPPLGPDILIVAVHLGSKLYGSDAGQDIEAARMARHILTREAQYGHNRTMVVGDFNMHPFQNGVVQTTGLHAVMDRRIASQGSRTVKGEEYPFFYNPMWSHFGDAPSGPPGTYFYRGSDHICHFWHMFDQVLLRPSLIPHFRDASLRILTAARGTSLVKPDGTPNPNAASDHLPIVFSLTI